MGPKTAKCAYCEKTDFRANMVQRRKIELPACAGHSETRSFFAPVWMHLTCDRQAAGMVMCPQCKGQGTVLARDTEEDA